MKKILTSFFMIVFLASFMPLGVGAAETIASGSLLKTADSSTIYYLGEDNKLYIFPNDKTYFSWFEGFDKVKVVSNETFTSYALGGNVYYKPGSLLVKTPTSYKVYAVGIGGELRWIESEAMAKEFYGDNWSKMVDDVPEGFFTNYRLGKSIAKSDDFDPEEEEDLSPTVSHGRGIKKMEKRAKKESNEQIRRCVYLQNSVNRLQARAARWGVEIPTLGDDYLANCLAKATGTKAQLDDDKKVTVCKQPRGNEANAHTITISKNALRKHLKEGYTLGACEDEDDYSDDSDDVTAPVVSAVSVNSSITSAVVTWTTNEESESKVEYDDANPFVESQSVTDREDVKKHTLTISGLTASTTYYYIVKSIDGAGNIGTSSVLNFTTKNADASAPIISEIEVVTSEQGGIVSWTTNEEANSKLYYSLLPFSASGTVMTLSNTELETTHDLTITGLATSTKCYFKIESADKWGNKALSGEQNFTSDEE